MADEVPSPLSYLDEQIEALKKHTALALTAFDSTAIHQARVATRRLKAAMDLLEPLGEGDSFAILQSTGKRLRRRLGPMRDLDVMIESLEKGRYPARLLAARDWLLFHCRADRLSVQAKDREKELSPEKMLKKFDQWWILRNRMQSQTSAIVPLITQSLHEQFERFSNDARQLLQHPEHLDVHQLRIDGKLLRYTIELAQAAGVNLPKKLIRQFKQLQEDLGQWHDAVVMAERVLEVMDDQEILLHDAAAARASLDLTKYFVLQSERHLKKFIERWQKLGPGIETELHERLPLVRVVSGTGAMNRADASAVAGKESDSPDAGENNPPGVG